MIHDIPLCDTLYKQRAHLLILKMLIFCRDNLAGVSRDTFFPDLEIKLRVWWQLSYLKFWCIIN